MPFPVKRVKTVFRYYCYSQCKRLLHDPKKANRSWRLTFRSNIWFCHRTVCEDFIPGQFAKILSPDKKWKMSITLKPLGIVWLTFAYTLILTRSSPRDCEMTFIIGRGFAELQIRKRWKWPYLLNWVEYYDKILHTHWYWQDVAQEIVKCHLGLVEVLPRFNFWKELNWPYLLNLLVYFDKNLHTHYYWHDIDRGIAKPSPRDCKMTFNIGRSCAYFQIMKM